MDWLCSSAAEAEVHEFEPRCRPHRRDAEEWARSPANPITNHDESAPLQKNTKINRLFISAGQRWSIRQASNNLYACFYMTVRRPSFKALLEIYMFLWNIKKSCLKLYNCILRNKGKKRKWTFIYSRTGAFINTSLTSV